MSAPTGSSRATGRRAGRSRVWRAAAARLTSSGPPTAGAYVLRHYRRGGLFARLGGDRFGWRDEQSTRSFAEWQLTYRLHRAGLPVPAPVAARYRQHGSSYTGDIITERLPAVGSLAACLRTAALSVLTWISIGRCIRRFHDLGVCHADLNAHNVLLSEEQVLPGRLRSLPAARPGLVARRQPGAPAPLAGESDLGAAGGALRRGRLARPARWLPPERRPSRRRHKPRAALATAVPAAAYLAVPIVSSMLLWRGLRDRSYWRNFSERFGFGALWRSAAACGCTRCRSGRCRRARRW